MQGLCHRTAWHPLCLGMLHAWLSHLPALHQHPEAPHHPRVAPSFLPPPMPSEQCHLQLFCRASLLGGLLPGCPLFKANFCIWEGARQPPVSHSPRRADPPDCRVPPIQGPLFLHWGYPIFPIAPVLPRVLLLPVGAHTGSRV